MSPFNFSVLYTSVKSTFTFPIEILQKKKKKTRVNPARMLQVPRMHFLELVPMLRDTHRQIHWWALWENL